MFLYFDLGNVLLHFDHELACRQMAAVAGRAGSQVAPRDVRRILFDSGLEDQYESGRVSTREVHDAFCREAGVRLDVEALAEAASDIFSVNVPMKRVLGALAAAGHPLGLLSNTNEAHWQFVTRRFAMFPAAFRVLALSFQIGAMKPEQEIYRRAAELAGAPPEEIFFVDDTPANVQAAQAAGFDAVLYSTAPALVAELRARGVRMNL